MLSASLTQWQQIFFFKSSVISPNKQSQNANLSRFLLKFNFSEAGTAVYMNA
jgi:hypothetical protein